MDFNLLQTAIESMPANTPFRIANEARPSEAYYLASFLPEIGQYDYEINAANMIIKATMAEHVGMDAPYREGGFAVASTFKESTAKIANRVTLPEAAQRRLQTMVMRKLAAQSAPLPLVINTYLNFINKLIVQPHIDTAEWLRARAIFTGAIDWTCDGRRLLVDYGFKNSHKLADLTGNNAFNGSTSQFWPFLRTATRLLHDDVTAFVMAPETVESAIDNPVNRIEVIDIEKIDRYRKRYKLRRLTGQTERPDPDKRYSAEIIAYAMESEVIDETAPSTTKKLRMIQPGEVAAIGGASNDFFIVGEGSTPADRIDARQGDGIGYTHMAPTVEGDGEPGRFADAYRPERQRWIYEGVGVSNLLPVIPEDDRVVIVRTAMP